MEEGALRIARSAGCQPVWAGLGVALPTAFAPG
jgi:hypothetical protein